VLERYEQHGSVFSTWILGKRTTFVGSLDGMKWLLNKEHDLVEGVILTAVFLADGTRIVPSTELREWTHCTRHMLCLILWQGFCPYQAHSCA